MFAERPISPERRHVGGPPLMARRFTTPSLSRLVRPENPSCREGDWPNRKPKIAGRRYGGAVRFISRSDRSRLAAAIGGGILHARSFLPPWQIAAEQGEEVDGLSVGSPGDNEDRLRNALHASLFCFVRRQCGYSFIFVVLTSTSRRRPEDDRATVVAEYSTANAISGRANRLTSRRRV